MPRARLHFGAFGSVTVTSCSLFSPLLVTTIVQLAGAPLATVCDFGFFVIWMSGVVTFTVGFGVGAGVGGVSAATVTWAESLAVTSGPVGGVPTSVATLVKLAVTFGRLHV